MRSLFVVALVATIASAQCPPGVLQNFDSAALGAPACGSSPGVYPPCWADGGGGQPWRVWTGTTPSAGTGPSGDNTTGSGNYLYCEASTCSGIQHYLLSPCVDLTQGAPSLTFAYHLYGASAGTLTVDEFDGVGGWVQVFTITGDQGNAWQTTTIALTPISNGQLRFGYLSGGSFDSDCAIDDVMIGTPLSDYEQNSPGSSLDLDGVMVGGPYGPPAITGQCTNNLVTATSSSTNAGLGWEAAIALGGLRPSSCGGTVTAGGQVINIDAFAPSTSWFNGGATIGLAPYPAGGFTLPFSVGSVPGTLTVQQVNISPTHADGYELSQACELVVSAGPTFPVAGPAADDSNVTVDLGCPAVAFFGTTYQQLHVSSNGRVMFGGPDTDWSPTIPELLAGNGSAGFWSDMSPQIAGASIDISNPAPGVYSVNFVNVPYYLEPNGTNTYSIVFDASTGGVILDNLTGISDNPFSNSSSSAGDVQTLGISPGGGATDPGVTMFSPGGAGIPGLATDAIYDFFPGGSAGRCPSLAAGTNQIQFLPAGSSYGWVAN